MNDQQYHIRYEFRFNKGQVELFDIPIDSKSLLLLWPLPEKQPAWTILEYKQCLCCTLKKDAEPYCPVAKNISKVVSRFTGFISHEKCIVSCKTPERTYQKKTSVMEGLSSILGIVMATSRCPIMEIFRPMARFHLPFSTVEETLVRSTSFYLLRQYFKHNNKRSSDFNLKHLQGHYQKLKLLNEGLLARINALKGKDSDKNALLVFHSITEILSLEIETHLQSIEYLFSDQPDNSGLKD
jgi:hypothetical protein